ncbi:hypothetical protein NNO_1937 [Hydrogenimonas sp.]|nr:hypothetical protein NNO_1937 [Hydrogenimonas sp.]
MNKIKMSLVAALAAAAATTGANAGALDNILSNPKLDIELRPRYEAVDDSVKKEASALTVRTAIGVQAGLLGVDGLNTQLQAMSVDHFGLVNDYNGVTSGDATYATIADPAQTRMTQANISYSANGFTGIVGRKMVVLDNARFIGNVGWRQMPQTYDLAAGIYNGIENLSLLAAYVTRVNRVVESTVDTGSVLLHASYKVMPELTVTAYDYMIQNYADHIGVRATGKVNLEGVGLKYEAEYAVQNDPTMDDANDPILANATNTSITQDASYYKLALDASMNGFTVGAGYEVLSDKGNGADPFFTPLATLHAMNGWADVFLGGTPDEGLVDMTLKLGYNAGEYGKIVGIYHNFTSDVNNAAGQDDLGSEVDVAYNVKVAKGLGLLLKGAWYTAGDASFGKNDVTKYWVQLDYKFHAEL